jgi:hypothetical protein
MKLLIALLAAIGAAAVAGFFFWRRNPKAVNSAWSQATDTTSTFAGTAADKTAEVAHEAADAATTATDSITGATH